MADRVFGIAGGAADLVLDTAPASNALPDLIRIAGADPRRVLTVADFEAAARYGARSSLGEDATLRCDVLGDFARLAAAGRLTVPVARTFGLEEWPTALKVSQGGQARGKLVILPGGVARRHPTTETLARP